MIRADHLFFRHKGSRSFQLRDLSLSVPKNSFSVILGPNGSGKTTLLKCLAGFWKACQGEIHIDRLPLSTLSVRERAQKIAYVPQHHHPVFPYEVLDVVLMGRTPFLPVLGFPGQQDRAQARKALEMMGISHLRHRAYSRLSGGERQLVLIARSLAQNAFTLFLDEPVSSLDFKNQTLVMQQIRWIVSKTQMTVLMTLHDPNLACSFADHLIMVKNGQVSQEGKPGEIMTAKALSRLYGIQIKVQENDCRRFVYVDDAPDP